MADIGDPALPLPVDARLISAAALQIIVPTRSMSLEAPLVAGVSSATVGAGDAPTRPRPNRASKLKADREFIMVSSRFSTL
jgi:hypothetical protein